MHDSGGVFCGGICYNGHTHDNNEGEVTKIEVVDPFAATRESLAAFKKCLDNNFSNSSDEEVQQCYT
jgi:hypothetical protein